MFSVLQMAIPLNTHTSVKIMRGKHNKHRDSNPKSFWPGSSSIEQSCCFCCCESPSFAFKYFTFWLFLPKSFSSSWIKIGKKQKITKAHLGRIFLQDFIKSSIFGCPAVLKKALQWKSKQGSVCCIDFSSESTMTVTTTTMMSTTMTTTVTYFDWKSTSWNSSPSDLPYKKQRPPAWRQSGVQQC